MIKITKGTTNQIYTTLSERGYVSSDAISMSIVGKQNDNTKIITLGDDISVNPARWNVFEIEDNEIEDLDNAVVNFTQPSYDYFIYKGDILLEKGLLRVDGLINETEFNIDNNNTEYTFT